MKDVKIPGSKFLLSLEDDENQWFLRLRINNAVEDDIALTHLEEKALRSNIEELLTSAHVNLNDLQIDMIQKDIWSFIQQKLSAERGGPRSQHGTIRDARYEELINRLDKLTTSVEELEQIISEKEKILT